MLPKTLTQARKEWAALVKDIITHDRLYYQEDAPIISDAAYDQLRRRLEALENEFPELRIAESPTNRVGAAVDNKFQKVTHPVRLYSLDNVFSDEEMTLFVRKARRFLGLSDDTPVSWLGDLKIDGLTVILHYKNGSLIQAATRGDGEVGEDITHNILTISSIPKILSGAPDALFVQGEVYMKDQDLLALNKEREKDGLPPFVNSRNSAAGSLRQLDPAVTAKRPLHFLAYAAAGLSASTHDELLSRLENLGIPCQKERAVCASLEDITAFFHHAEDLRDKNPYPIDGVVYKIDRRDWQERLGHSARTPRFAFAYKFRAQEAETVLQAIEIQVGRTGTLTPVAHLSPVFLGGASLSRASLFNEDEIARKDIRVHDTVIMRRSGDVIPYVIGPVLAKRPPSAIPFAFPHTCPMCGSPAERLPGEVARKCRGGVFCPAQAIWRIRHFASRAAFDIEGMGAKTATEFYHEGRLRTPADIFTLAARNAHSPLEKRPGWGVLSAQNLFSAIESRRHISLNRFIYALGIPEIGEETARVLATHYETCDAWLAAMISDPGGDAYARLLTIEGIGPAIAQALSSFFGDPRQIALVEELLSHVTVLSFMRIIVQHSVFSGKTIIFTGTLSRMTRAEAKARAEKLGAKVVGSVSSKTDYVVVGENAGSKARVAQELGVKCLSENEWMTIIEQQNIVI